MTYIETLSSNQQKLVFIVAVFAIYLIVIVGFAILYYRAFLKTPSSFSFAASIAEGQRENRVGESEAYIAHLMRVDCVLAEVAEALCDRADTRIDPGGWNIRTMSGALEYLDIPIPVAPAGVTFAATMTVLTSANEPIGKRYQWGSRGGSSGTIRQLGSYDRKLRANEHL